MLGLCRVKEYPAGLSFLHPYHMLPHDLQRIARAIVGSHCVGAVPEVEMAPNRLSRYRA